MQEQGLPDLWSPHHVTAGVVHQAHFFRRDQHVLEAAEAALKTFQSFSGKQGLVLPADL